MATAMVDLITQPRRSPGRPKGTFRGRRAARFAVPSSPAYVSWLAGLARHLGAGGMADAVREALRRLAGETGYSAPPLK